MTVRAVALSAILVSGGGLALYVLNSNDNPVSANETGVLTDQQNPNNKKNETDKQSLITDMQTEEHLIDAHKKKRELETKRQEAEVAAMIAAEETAKKLATQRAEQEQSQTQEAAKQRETPVQTVVDDTVTDLQVQTRPEVIAQQNQAKQEAKTQAKTEEPIKKTQETKPKETAKAISQKDTPETNPQATARTKEVVSKEPVSTNKKSENTNNTQANKPNKKGQHTIERGDTLIKLSHQYGIPVSILAKANNMGRNDALPVGKTIKIPSKSDIEKLQKADKPTESAKTKDKETKPQSTVKTVPTHYSVQVAMADNQAKADELAKTYRAAGYKVVTSRTSKGVRVLVGSERSKEAANTLKSKITKDSRVKTDGAWVKQVDTINP